MESEETYRERKLKEKEYFKMLNSLCKNGCGKKRASGSSRCKECSDKHKVK
jgi:hypothetical protein